MRKFIVFGGGLVVLAAAALLLASLQYGIHLAIKGDGAKVLVNVNCSVQDTVTDDDNVSLQLDCQGRKKVVSDPKVVVSYLKNPGPLTCTIYKSGKVKCQERKPDKPVEKN